MNGSSIAVVQARMGSTRLPGKALAVVGDLPLIAWVIAALRAVPELATIVVALTEEERDEPLADVAASLGVHVHRGPTDDVLTRVAGAARPHGPAYVVRATADNPFLDPDVVGAQLARARAEGLDYVGLEGWPLGIGAEVVGGPALESAAREARDPREREHVVPFVYTHPERFGVARLRRDAPNRHVRFTVDTAADLAFARALAARLGHGPPARLAELEAILDAEPGLAELNAEVRQKGWQEAE